VRWWLVAVVILIGFFVGFGSGLIENDPGFLHIPEQRYYGFPLVWRMVDTASGEKFTYPVELLADIVFGIVMVATVVLAMSLTVKYLNRKEAQKQEKTKKKQPKRR
jgi:hypothetical protein